MTCKSEAHFQENCPHSQLTCLHPFWLFWSVVLSEFASWEEIPSALSVCLRWLPLACTTQNLICQKVHMNSLPFSLVQSRVTSLFCQLLGISCISCMVQLHSEGEVKRLEETLPLCLSSQKGIARVTPADHSGWLAVNWVEFDCYLKTECTDIK